MTNDQFVKKLNALIPLGRMAKKMSIELLYSFCVGRFLLYEWTKHCYRWRPKFW